MARFELITASFCTNPRYFSKDTIPEITRIAPLYPIHQVSPTQTEFDYTRQLRHGIDYCFNLHSVYCFYYFVVYKIFHVLVWSCLLIPLLLTIMVIPFIGLPVFCLLTRLLGEFYVDGSRYVLVPGWKSERRKDVFTNVFQNPIFFIPICLIGLFILAITAE